MYNCSYRSYHISISISHSHFSIEIVLINLIRHDHHPQQKHRPDDIKRKRGLPVLADPLRLQPRERRLPVRQARARLVEVAVAVDGAGGAVELDGGFDEAGEEEDEEDEGAEDDDAGEQLALLDQDEDYQQEEQAQGAGCYAVGEYPRREERRVSQDSDWLVGGRERGNGDGCTYHGTPR